MLLLLATMLADEDSVAVFATAAMFCIDGEAWTTLGSIVSRAHSITSKSANK
jgi:hypothetical protein